jgi:hypothetical protein
VKHEEEEDWSTRITMSAHVKFILVGGAVLMCAIALDSSLELSKQLAAELFASRTEYDADADALKKVADRVKSEEVFFCFLD